MFWLRNKKIIVWYALLTEGLMPIKNSQVSMALSHDLLSHDGLSHDVLSLDVLSLDVLSHDGLYFFCRASESVSVAIDGRVGQMTGQERNG